MDVVLCLKLVAHRVLLQVMEELDLFTSFSSWLRVQIDRLASSSSATDELSEKEATLDNSKVLAYVQNYLTQSPLALFFDDTISQEEADADWQAIDSGASLLDTLDAQLKRHEEGQPYMKGLPHTGFLVSRLDQRASAIFGDIAEAQKRSVRFGQPTKIALEHDIASMDSFMCSELTAVSYQIKTSYMLEMLMLSA